MQYLAQSDCPVKLNLTMLQSFITNSVTRGTDLRSCREGSFHNWNHEITRFVCFLQEKL